MYNFLKAYYYKFQHRLGITSVVPNISVAEVDDFFMVVSKNEIVGKLILTNRYERDELEYLSSNIKPDDIFFDVGANVGLFSLKVASMFPSVQVHAFEPIPKNANMLELSKSLNNLDNVTVNKVCLGDVSGVVNFSIACDSAFSSLIPTKRVPEERTFKCQMIRLDDYIASKAIEKADVLKIDVEGAELIVLKGAEKVLTKIKPRLILMELYQPNFSLFGTSIEEVLSFMKSYGYDSYVLIGGVRRSFTKNMYGKIYNVFFEQFN